VCNDTVGDVYVSLVTGVVVVVVVVMVSKYISGSKCVKQELINKKAGRILIISAATHL
jgi:hypothetical protein